MFSTLKKQLKSSRVIEAKYSAEIKKILPTLYGRVLHVFDVDNALFWLGDHERIEGTDPWFIAHLNAKKEELDDLTAAEIATLKIFIDIHTRNPIHAVESETIEMIKQLQHEKKDAIALTSRSGKYLAELTRQQARTLGFCFSNTERFKSKKADLTHLGPHCFVDEGYFYTGGKNKGHVLQAGLEAIGIFLSDYDYLFFMDDDPKKIQDVQEMAAGKINFVGVRYGFLDEHLTTVTKKVAEFFSKK
jgi:hypothetical protein